MPLRIFLICVLAFCSSICRRACSQDPFSGGADPFGGQAADPFGSDSTPMDNNPFGASAVPAADGGFGGFGQSGGPAQPAAADIAPAQDAAEEKDPVVRLLRETPPQTTSDMARALTWVTRLRRWDEVGRLLDRTQAFAWDLQQKAALAREAGSALWIRLRSSDVGLTDQQRQLVTEILSAPATLARAPQWIDQWIDKLGSDSPGERRLAQLRLQDGSLASVQRLLARLLEGDPKVAPVMLAGTANEFGADGREALQAACQLADPERVSRVLLALAELPSLDFAAELGAALAGQKVSADVKAKLSESLRQRFSTLPSDTAVRAYLEKKFQDGLTDYQQARSSRSGLPVLVWRPTSDRQAVQVVEARSPAPQLERIAQLAALRLWSSEVDLAETVGCSTVLLQRAYHVNPQLSEGELGSNLLTDFTQADFVNTDFWIAVFDQADQWQMHGAALRALQLMAEQSAPTPEVVNFLSDLLSDPRPMIRYSALQAMDTINPTSPYRGSDQAIAAAIEMTKLQSGPQALVIGLNPSLREAAQLQIQLQTGSEVVTVNSARGALLALDGEAPIELIFVVDRVADQSLFELIQRLRQTKHGHSLPIAVLTEKLYAYERELIERTAGVVSSVLSRNVENMSRVIELMVRELDTQPMSPAERSAFSQTAGRFLTKVAGDPDRYRFYHVSDWRESLVSTATGLNVAAQSQLLSGLGSAESQRKLIQLAAMNSKSQAERSGAANAFGDSIKRFGLRLDRTSVASCYELYNALGPQDAVAMKVLGFCLDVIEAQAGQAAWPERL